MSGTDTQQPATLVTPRSIEEAGLSWDLVYQLVSKTLHVGGEQTGADLSARLGVPFSVIEPLLDHLRREHYCEVSGGGALGPASYLFRLAQSGHAQAQAHMERSQYVGALPVPLVQYRAYMQRLAEHHRWSVNREMVRRAFRHLVISDHVLDQLGPAVAAGHSLFIYGPPGNGKTMMARAIRHLLPGEIYIPHAIAVDTEIIRMYDAVSHVAVPDETLAEGLERNVSFDGRWVRCARPLVAAGGELTAESLELGYSAASGFYRAPLQAIANGGVLIIDDFGRQRMAPGELLNRWIVPLEDRVDHLTLRTGQKVEMPFNVLVVFATNSRPSSLVDEAFFRRIRYKVHAESPSREQFLTIFENYCDQLALPFDLHLAEWFVSSEIGPRNLPLRGCYPRDIIDQALSLAAYAEQPRILTKALLSAASASYFVSDEREAPPVLA